MREKKEKLQEQEEPFDLKKEIFEWVKIIIAAAAIAFFLNTFIIANSTVPSGSMETTIMTGDRIIGSRLAYKLGGDPERGDIVIFDHETGPGNEETRLVKRVIGLPGETVEIRDNQLYIDGLLPDAGRQPELLRRREILAGSLCAGEEDTGKGSLPLLSQNWKN